jgi:hypothetical protein
MDHIITGTPADLRAARGLERASIVLRSINV